MKKFCSTCGNQLELSQRLCSQCGTVNPFYSSAFKLLSDQSDALEKLKSEKERIERELLEKEQEQAEFKKQELLKKSKELEERGVEESVLKQELQRVKEETEKYKKETYDLVKEVREEIHQIEADNKRLKQEIENIAKSALQNAPKTETAEKEASGGRAIWFIVLMLIFLISGGGVAYLLLNKTPEQAQPTAANTNPLSDTLSVVIANDTIPGDTAFAADTSASVADSASVTPPAKPAATSVQSETSPAQNTTVAKTETENKPFAPTSAKIKSDLIGRRISGCDIVIGKSSEIESIRDITLIEKLPNGMTKYKCSVQITQNEESYSATPYVYYTTGGSFIKVDGTNCE